MGPRGFGFLTLLTLSVIAGACKDDGDPVANTPLPGDSPTSYNYKAYNSKSVLVVVGTLRLTSRNGKNVEGTWSLEGLVPGEQVGPQTGTGSLSGILEGVNISLNLNPGWADNNVFLLGSFGVEGFKGKWTWSTFAGPTSEGTFEAIKIPS